MTRDRHVRGKWFGLDCRSSARTRFTRGVVRSASRWNLSAATAVACETSCFTEYPKPQRRRLVSFVLLNCSLTTCAKLKGFLQFTHRIYNLHNVFTFYTSCLHFTHRVYILHIVFIFYTSCVLHCIYFPQYFHDIRLS